MGLTRFEKFKYIYEKFLLKKYNDKIGKKLSNEFENLILFNISNSKLIYGIKKFLNDHSTDHIYYIASSAPTNEINIFLKTKKLSKYFKCVYGYPNKKTDAIKTIINNENVSLKKILMIGDTIIDYNAAKYAKINFLGITKNSNIFPKNTKCVKNYSLIGNLKNFQIETVTDNWRG